MQQDVILRLHHYQPIVIQLILSINSHGNVQELMGDQQIHVQQTGSELVHVKHLNLLAQHNQQRIRPLDVIGIVIVT